MEISQLLDNAKGVGTFMGCIAIEAASLLATVREAKEALDAGDVDSAERVLNNRLAPGRTFHIETLGLVPAPVSSDTGGY